MRLRKMPYEDYGDPRNIVERALIDAGKTTEIKNAGRAQAKQNMLEVTRWTVAYRIQGLEHRGVGRTVGEVTTRLLVRNAEIAPDDEDGRPRDRAVRPTGS